MRPEAKNAYAGEDQQQFNQPTDPPFEIAAPAEQGSPQHRYISEAHTGPRVVHIFPSTACL
jgi:hypothetical protein